jgi:1,4-alpha-glucan branching enzyme
MKAQNDFYEGYLSLVLHAHLPYVRHPEYDDFLEEDWLYEAIIETYLPVLDMMENLVSDGIFFRMSMVITPTLAGMLSDQLLQERFDRFLHKRIELAEKEVHRTRNNHLFNPVARFYLERFTKFLRKYQRTYHRNLINAFRQLQNASVLEILTCAATHALLPMYQMFPEAIRAQISLGVSEYERHFGRLPTGIWLPECGYFPGLDQYLMESGIRYFIVDSHGLLYANPRPRYGVFAPVFCPSGVAAFSRDIESSKQVWSAKEGYPGDAYYRDFYRDIGYDLDFEYIKPYIQPTGLRKFTGLKYYRITGDTDHKMPYMPGEALNRVVEHAGNFVFNRERQVEYLRQRLGKKPVILSPYDAELFGHWWFEGPEFLNFVLRKTGAFSNIFRTITPSEYLSENPTNQLSIPAQSSWGDKGYFEVWLNETNDWIYPHIHGIIEHMTDMATEFRNPHPLLRRALNQCARELTLLMASDWAFIMNTKTSVEYAVKRTKNHIARFNRIHGMIVTNRIDENVVSEMESADNIFPEIDYMIFRRGG